MSISKDYGAKNNQTVDKVVSNTIKIALRPQLGHNVQCFSQSVVAETVTIFKKYLASTWITRDSRQ